MAQEDDQIRVIVRALEGVAEQVMKKITLSATANLQRATPILTGWARSNWIPSIGTPYSGLAGSREGDDIQLDPSVSASGQAAIATGYKLPMGSVFVTNNVPYIGPLNRGHSKKAPEGFVEAALEKAVLQVKI